MKVQIVAPEMFSISIFFKKGMELVSLPRFVLDFSRKLFLMLYSIDWPYLIVWLPLWRRKLWNLPSISYRAVSLHDQKVRTKILALQERK